MGFSHPLRRTAPPPAPLAPLPAPARIAERLRDTPFAAEVAALARRIHEHRFPLLGLADVATGPEIAWRRDYRSGLETATLYFRKIPYLDAARAGDHKIIWELNRHQHLVLLAQAYWFDQDKAHITEIVRQLDSWIEANPFQRGMNWVSALEVAFRALSWIWVEHLVGACLPASFRARFLEVLYQHGLHLETNLSVYFSPNTHLLGEAVALHALGRLFPWFARAEAWRRSAAAIVAEQMTAQVKPDGSHFEQSSYYHVYAVDMFLFHALLEPATPAYLARLQRMGEYLDALLGPAGELPFFGDDDGGRFFHPFGRHSRYGRATLATCGRLFGRPEWVTRPDDLAEQATWWLPSLPDAVPAADPPARSSQRWEDAGMAVLQADGNQICFDAGPFGTGRAGHSHSDTLSLTVRWGEREVLIDPGTYSYMDREWRERFRGSSAHNTIRINGQDQAQPLNPFAWSGKPEVVWKAWDTQPDYDRADASCSYAGFTHRRRLLFLKPALLFVVDEVSGPPGEHLVEQYWHLGAPEMRSQLVLADGAAPEEGWRSPALGAKVPAPVWKVTRRGTLPCRIPAAIVLREKATVTMETTGDTTTFRVAGDPKTYTIGP